MLRFDSVGGASGDMILGSLCALGIEPKALRAAVAALPIEHFDIVAEPHTDRGIGGTRVHVAIPHSHHEHRNLAMIVETITVSKLPESVKARSIRVFTRLAEAEARVHNTTPDRVHFHEVGALDAIVDIVGSCLALDMLRVDAVVVGPLPCGCGTITCAHGVLPNPAPATVELLGGHPLVQTDEPFELVTPTGAALLMEWKAEGRRWPAAGGRRQEDAMEKARVARSTYIPLTRSEADRPLPPGGEARMLHSHMQERETATHTHLPLPLRERVGVRGTSAAEVVDGEVAILEVGNGFGRRTLNGRPNLLRAMLLQSRAPATPDTDECVVLECNLDDTTPELIGFLAQKLMAGGALDVFTMPAQMKKQRPGVLLTVLCSLDNRARLVDMIFAESTTFGVRERTTRRYVLQRRSVEVQTPYGTIRVKIGTWKGRDVTRSPEYEDCVRCAEQHAVAVRQVYDAALRGV